MSEPKQPSAEEQAAAEAAAEAVRKEAEAKAAAKEAPAKKPKWQERDYNGPLTGDQAAWRNANIKPVAEVRRK